MLELVNMVTIKRIEYTDKQTLGLMYYNGKEVAKTLELADKNNAPKISCIPKGTYKVVGRYSQKYGNHFHITDVPNRSFILIHNGNYHTQILGCVLVGKAHLDINKDGYKDVTASKDKMKELLALLPNEFTLTIE